MPVVLLSLVAGCQPPLPPAMTLGQVVETLNRNNEQLPWFKARLHTVTATVTDDRGWPHRLDMYGFLIYAQPDHVNMDCSIGGESVMGLGSNSEQFWLWIRPQVARCWVGWHERWKPSRGDIPIHPRQLTQLLGVDAVPTDFSRRPWPVLRVSDPKDRANILQFCAPVDGHVAILRELWVDRDSNRPRRVRLFDGQGQVVIESTLGSWKKVKAADAAFPHDVSIRWIVRRAAGRPAPGGAEGFIETTGNRLRLLFSDVEVSGGFDPARRPRVYDFRPPGDVEIVPLDQPAATTAGDAI